MIFPKRVRFFPCVLGACIFLAYSCCFVIADENCYRGSAFLEYDNPCSGQPAKLELCPKGQRLATTCTENCTYCDDGTYQDTFTNCLTCLPCTTAADCPPGQEIIKNCKVDSNAVCGCPPPPPCPVCPSCPTATPCPSVTPCPVQTECPACPTDAPVVTEPHQSTELRLIRKCPANILAGALSGSNVKTVEWIEPQATDGATIIQSRHPGDSFLAGNTTVVYVFKLDSDVIDCSFVVTVTEETDPPTTPFSRDETTKGNKPEAGSQKNNDCNSCVVCWILFVIAILAVVVLIVLIVAGCTCCKQYLPKDPTQHGTRQPQVVLNQAGEVHQPRAEPNVYHRDTASLQAPQPLNTAPDEHLQSESVEMELQELIGQPEEPPGRSNNPNGAEGGYDGSAAASETSSNRGGGRLHSSDQPPEEDSRTPLISSQSPPSVSHQNPGPSGVQYLTQNSRTPLMPPQSPPSSALPHQGIDRLSSSDHLPDRDLNSAVAPFSVSSSAYGVAQGGSDTADSSTQPLLTSSSPSSAMPSQNPGTSGRQSFQQNPGPSRVSSSLQRNSEPEQLITLREDRRESPVSEMEIQWLAAMMNKHFSQRREPLYRHLNIAANAVNRIKHEKSQDINNIGENEVFNVVNYGWCVRENPTEEENTRCHLIEQLYTFDKRLAKAYANYINSCRDFSVMWILDL